MRWQFLMTGYGPGSYNMALDAELAAGMNIPESIPILRLYGWKPPAISIGFHQQMSDFDGEKLASAGIDLVQRPTGGRAIFHVHEVTYSVVLPLGIAGPRTLYEQINTALLDGVRRLGIDANLTQRQSDFRTLYASPASIPCFTSSAKSEIQVGGKKLIGSAQRRFGNVILQHGSFLLGPAHRRITDFVSARAEQVIASIARELEEHTTEAETILGRPVSFGEAAAQLKAGFEHSLGIQFDAYDGPLPAITQTSPVAIEAHTA